MNAVKHHGDVDEQHEDDDSGNGQHDEAFYLMASSATRLRIHGTDRDRFRRCEASQKVGFQTRSAALDAAERMMEQGLVKPGCHITPYACPACHEWHVANRTIVAVAL